MDQASAQFAASALVTADQLLALKTKEELGPGVNGVLSPSGITASHTTTGLTNSLLALKAHVVITIVEFNKGILVLMIPKLFTY